jgi:hypothetical protein
MLHRRLRMICRGWTCVSEWVRKVSDRTEGFKVLNRVNKPKDLNPEKTQKDTVIVTGRPSLTVAYVAHLMKSQQKLPT